MSGCYKTPLAGLLTPTDSWTFNHMRAFDLCARGVKPKLPTIEKLFLLYNRGWVNMMVLLSQQIMAWCISLTADIHHWWIDFHKKESFTPDTVGTWSYKLIFHLLKMSNSQNMLMKKLVSSSLAMCKSSHVCPRTHRSHVGGFVVSDTVWRTFFYF